MLYNEPIMVQIGISSPRNNGVKSSTLDRSKVKPKTEAPLGSSGFIFGSFRYFHLRLCGKLAVYASQVKSVR